MAIHMPQPSNLTTLYFKQSDIMFVVVTSTLTKYRNYTNY